MILVLCILFVFTNARRFEAFKTTHAYHFKVSIAKDRLKATINPKTRYLRIYDSSIWTGSGISRTWQLPDDADLDKTHMERIPNYLHVVIPKKVPAKPVFNPPTDTYIQRGQTVQILSETSSVCLTRDKSTPACHRNGMCQHGERITEIIALDEITHLKARTCQYGVQSPVSEAIYNVIDDLEVEDVIEIEEVIDVTDAWKWKDRKGHYHDY